MKRVLQEEGSFRNVELHLFLFEHPAFGLLENKLPNKDFSHIQKDPSIKSEKKLLYNFIKANKLKKENITRKEI